MIKGYYFITDPELSKHGNKSDVLNAIDAGVSVVQYRDKAKPFKEFCEEARVLKEICKDKALFIINDRADAAILVGADGVHIGEEDISYEQARNMLGGKKMIGVTVHTKKEAVKFEEKGANYLAISPIFSTTTKKDAGEPVGVDLIKEVKKLTRLPIVAIGGINLKNVKPIIDSGVDAVCAISAVVASKNVKEEIKKFQALF